MDISNTDNAIEQVEIVSNPPSYSLPISLNWWRFFVTDFFGVIILILKDARPEKNIGQALF